MTGAPMLPVEELFSLSSPESRLLLALSFSEDLLQGGKKLTLIVIEREDCVLTF